MQEEIEQKSFNIMISTTKLSARTVLRAVKAAFRLYQSKTSQGKQSVRTLLRQNRGVSSVEISKTGIRGLERYAKKYGIDYAIRKDSSEVPPRYLVFFKAPDAEAFNSAFKEYVVTVTDEETGALTPEGNLTLVDDYHTDYSDGSGQQFITLVSKSGATFYLVIDRNAKGQQTVHFMNLVDEADLLALMEEDAADAYTAEKEAAAQAELDRLKAEEEAKKAAEEAAASGEEQPKENKVTKIASGFLGVVVLIALAAGGGFYVFAKQKQKKQAEKEALDPDANYTEDKGDFEIPVEDEPEETDEEDTEPI